jgi:hypothetical protein
MTPRTYDHRSDSSHKRVTLHFCGRCATTLCLSFERFPEVVGVMRRHVRRSELVRTQPGGLSPHLHALAQRGVVLPAGLETYLEHAMQLDGTSSKPIVLDHPRLVTREE